MAKDPKSCFATLLELRRCEGVPVTPGIKRSAYLIPVSSILGWPKLPVDEYGRPTSATYEGAFTLAEGEKFKRYDHLPSKAEFKSESQGEEPSKTFKVTTTIVHPGIGPEAAAAATTLINSRVIAIVEDMEGRYRVVGCEKYNGATVSPSRDNGQGATGSAGTTFALEADDAADAPFYNGPIPTEDGIINEGAATEP
ncbi:MAG: hypothetical protein K1V80_03040 [Muribaculaceae bacterium]|uniref:hypothetical protein n=1 Tax=uncultured Muribaculum sp. TaxID=1918613 RepID=UPI0026EBD662|nr:hypothetical protein [uncultured Muribaculum sp.]